VKDVHAPHGISIRTHNNGGKGGGETEGWEGGGKKKKKVGEVTLLKGRGAQKRKGMDLGESGHASAPQL